MKNQLAPITDKQAEVINGGFLNTTITQNGKKSSAFTGQGFFVGVGYVGAINL